MTKMWLEGNVIVMDHEEVAVISPRINSSTVLKIYNALAHAEFPDDEISEEELQGSDVSEEFRKTTLELQSKAKAGLINFDLVLELLKKLEQRLLEGEK